MRVVDLVQSDGVRIVINRYVHGMTRRHLYASAGAASARKIVNYKVSL
jgi:hypothetical protein